jgi:hypothetical protein
MEIVPSHEYNACLVKLIPLYSERLLKKHTIFFLLCQEINLRQGLQRFLEQGVHERITLILLMRLLKKL